MRVVVSMTTLPSRIGRIKPMVDSIARQSRTPDLWLLHAPLVCLKEDSAYDLPDWLPMIVAQGGVDYGSATKLIPTLRSETDPDTLIITVPK